MTQFVPPRIPFVDLKSGQITKAWEDFLRGLFTIVGNGNGLTLAEVEALIRSMSGSMARDGIDGEDSNIPGPSGRDGRDGRDGVNGWDGQDAENQFYFPSSVSKTGTGDIYAMSNTPTLTTPKTTGYTVGTLPVGVVGMHAHVTDALAPVFLGILVGGGAVVTPCFFDGTNWIAE